MGLQKSCGEQNMGETSTVLSGTSLKLVILYLAVFPVMLNTWSRPRIPVPWPTRDLKTSLICGLVDLRVSRPYGGFTEATGDFGRRYVNPTPILCSYSRNRRANLEKDKTEKGTLSYCHQTRTHPALSLHNFCQALTGPLNHTPIITSLNILILQFTLLPFFEQRPSTPPLSAKVVHALLTRFPNLHTVRLGPVQTSARFKRNQDSRDDVKHFLQRAVRVHDEDVSERSKAMMRRCMMDGVGEDGEEEEEEESGKVRLPVVRDPLGYFQEVVASIVGGVPEGVRIEYEDHRKKDWRKLLARRAEGEGMSMSYRWSRRNSLWMAGRSWGIFGRDMRTRLGKSGF